MSGMARSTRVVEQLVTWVSEEGGDSIANMVGHQPQKKRGDAFCPRNASPPVSVQPKVPDAPSSVLSAGVRTFHDASAVSASYREAILEEVFVIRDDENHDSIKRALLQLIFV